MENLKKSIQKSTANYPYTACVRNYLATSPLLSTKYCEWNKGDNVYDIGITIYARSGRPKGPLLRVGSCGPKHAVQETLYQEILGKISYCERVATTGEFHTQGLDLDLNLEKDEPSGVVSKEQNVIITGADEEIQGGNDEIATNKLLDWSSSEGYFKFTEKDSALMSRWFALDVIKIDGSMGPAVNGGLVKSWVIPRDLINNDFEAINVLPIRGFLKGEYEMEFKMVLQANSFQQCCLMLSVAPFMYGVSTKLNVMQGVKPVSYNSALRPWSAIVSKTIDYADFQCAIQRPNAVIDVATGGEVTLKMSQKYHKTLIRNFDFSQLADVNPGISGSNFGSLMLHCVSRLKYGTGSTSFGVRVFYRFVKSNLTAMVPVVSKNAGVLLSSGIPVAIKHVPEAMRTIDSIRNVKSDKERNALMEKIQKFSVQGPIMSTLVGTKIVTDITKSMIQIFEKTGTTGRKGIVPRNRDKPNDVIHQVRVAPRPRTNFTNGVGIDDGIVMSVAWDELVNFFQQYTDEPTSFEEFARMTGYFGSFTWKVGDAAGAELFSWDVHPTHNPGSALSTDFGQNILRHPLGISSSAFTNYWGTMELMFQFVKTNSHKGAVEIAIYYGGSTSGSGLKSTYVKVLNLQDCPAFKVTVPYIYDTPVRYLAGTSTPFYLPDVTNPHNYSFYNTARVVVRVLNELSAVSVVSQEVDCVVWLKGGRDFGLNFPHPMNTMAFPQNFDDSISRNPTDCRRGMSSNTSHVQYFYNVSDASIGNYSADLEIMNFVTQGDIDFNQPEPTGNRVTSVDHMDFKTLLKMPVKIISDFEYTPNVTSKFQDIRQTEKGEFTTKNYFNLPVCPLNTSLVNFLNSQHYRKTTEAPDVSNSIRGNFEAWKSIQAQIMNMFSMFRGALVYTIVLTDGATTPVYYAYTPHDYALRDLYGPYYYTDVIGRVPGGDGQNYGVMGDGIPGMVTDKEIDLATLGLFNGFILPSVNPSERIIIPMSSQNNFILMNRQQAIRAPPPLKNDSAIRTMRENSEWFNGTLSLWSHERFKFDVYINCSDEIELAGFMGHPGVSNVYSAYAMTDNWRTQGLLDFQFKELTQTGWNSLKTTAMQFAVTIGASTIAFHLPNELGMVTGALALYAVTGGIRQVVDLRKAILNDCAAEKQRLVDEIRNIGANSFTELVEEAFPFLKTQAKAMGHKVFAIGQHIVHAILAQQWKNTAFSFFCVLMEIKVVELKDWENLREVMEEFVKSLIPEFFQTQGLLENVQEYITEEKWLPFMELLVVTICAKFQVSSSFGWRNYLGDIFRFGNYRHVTGLNAILNLARCIFRAVSTIVNSCLVQKDPNILLLKRLQDKDNVLGTFIEESHTFLNMFSDSDMRKREKRVKYVHTILRAYKLRTILLRINEPRLTSQLLSLCDKVIDKASKMRYLLRCDVVVPEPFIVCIEGDSNIGKSFSVYKMVSEMLKESGVKFYNPQLIFTIPAGVDYWNGYMDEPALWYDDWCNLVDEQTMRSHLSQIYALKTSAPFNVPRAELDNKEQIATPLLVVLTTNNPFPQSNVISNHEAVYRRRDVLVKFSLVGGKTIKDFSQEQLENYEHIQVQTYNDVTKITSLQSARVPFSQFLNELKVKFVQFRQKEAMNQKQKYQTLLDAIERSPIDNVDIENPFVAIETFIHKNTEVTTSMLEDEIEALVERLKDQMDLLKDSPSDDEIFSTQGFCDGISETRRRLRSYFCGKVHDTGRAFDSWIQAYREKSMRCANCGAFAAVQGTVFWCTEHAHYVCFHCTMLFSARVNQQKLEVNGELGDLPFAAVCPFSEDLFNPVQLKVAQESIYKSIILEMVSGTIDTPIQLLTFLKNVVFRQQWNMQAAYGFIIFLKAYVFMYSILVRRTLHNVFSTQGKIEKEKILISKSEKDQLIEYRNSCRYAKEFAKVEYNEDWMCLDDCGEEDCKNKIVVDLAKKYLECLRTSLDQEEATDEVHTFCRTYTATPQRAGIGEVYINQYTTERAELQDFRDLYDKQILADSSRNKGVKYVCQHSLLLFSHTFREGKYSVFVDGNDIIELKDLVCKGSKCVLLNKRFLELAFMAFQYDSNSTSDVLQRFDAAGISFYIPRYLQAQFISDVLNDKQKCKALFAKNWWDNYISPVGEWFTSLIKKILPILVACGVIWGAGALANKTWKYICNLFGISEPEGLFNSGSTPTRKPKVKTRTRNPYRTQANLDENFVNKLDKVLNNYARLTFGTNKVTIWGLKGNVALIPKHLAEPMMKFRNVTFEKVNSNEVPRQILTSNIVVETIEGQDLSLVTFLRQAPMFKDCTHFLRTEDELDETFTEGVFLHHDVVDNDVDEYRVKIFGFIREFSALQDETNASFTTQNAVMYDFQQKGACGSVVCVNSIRPVYAIHVAGCTSTGRGVGAILKRLTYSTQGLIFDEIDDTDEEVRDYGPEVKITYVASIGKEMIPYVPKRSTIVPSLISECFQSAPLTMPAILTADHPMYQHELSPLVYGVKKNGQPTIDFPVSVIKRAFVGVSNLMLRGKKIRQPSILSVKQAIVGMPDVIVDDKYIDMENPYYDSLPLDTSSGFPYSSNLYKKKFGFTASDKTPWITYERRKDLRAVDCTIHPKLEEDHENNMQLRKKGIIPNNIFQDCLKDERRPIEKALSVGGTRLFSMSNVEGTIALRRYTLDLTSFLRFNRIFNGVGIGINPDSMEWTILANSLLSISNNIFTTDFTNFGAGLNLGVASYFMDLILDFFTQYNVPLPTQEKKCIEVLVMELLASRHVAGNLIYGTICGSPSGAAITVEINSFTHLMYIVISFLIIGEVNRGVNKEILSMYSELGEYLNEYRNPKLQFTIEDFFVNVYCCTYGDDGIFSVSDEYKELFNSITINLVLSRHKIGVTDATKSQKIQKYTRIEEATFLKRGFVRCELLSSIWLSKMSWTTVEECVRWIHNKPLPAEVATRENCIAALHLAVGHGSSKYAEFAQQINKYLKEKNLEPVLITWQDVIKKFFPELIVDEF